MAKKILSRSDLAQLILHQYYELHTNLISLVVYEISNYVMLNLYFKEIIFIQ